MKMTLIEMVQDIASDMNSDAVNSINDTPEAKQIAQIIKSTYYELLNLYEWPRRNGLAKLGATGDNTKPTHLVIPTSVDEIKELRYNTKKKATDPDRFEVVQYVSPDNFLTITDRYDSTDTTTQIVTDYSGAVLYIKNDRAPTYWTSFDDKYVVFNAYDKSIDSSLQSSKTRCIATLNHEFVMDDSFVPDLPESHFPLLLAEAKSACFLRIKQTQDAKAEQQAVRQRIAAVQRGWRAKSGISFPDYGRRSRK